MKKISKLVKWAVVGLLLSYAIAQDATTNHGIVVANIDRSVKPGDDFYRYANGEWLKKTQIAPDRASADVWSVLGDLSNKRTATLT